MQVAVIAPTTLLARQHYKSFAERFRGFPINVAPLSRFVSPSMPTVDPNPTSLATLKHRDPLLLGLFMLLFSLYVGIEITFAGWVTAYGTLSGLTTEHAALLATLFWLALSAGRLLAIPLLRVCSPWQVLAGCLALGLSAAAGLHLNALPPSAGALLFGLSASAFFPTLFALCNQSIVMRGRTTGAIFTAAGSGALVIPSLTGPLLDLAGAGAFPILLATLWLLIALGLLLLASRLRQLAVRQGG